MKQILHTLFSMVCLALMLPLGQAGLSAQTPTLGTYTNTSLQAGRNITISPSVAPTNTARIVAYTNTNFTGVLTVNPTTGVVRVTNAKQAGIDTVTVKAFAASGNTATRTFVLTVTDPNCSQGQFTIPFAPFWVGNDPNAIAIGDFDGDGKQDIAIATTLDDNVKIGIGNGTGHFNTNGPNNHFDRPSAVAIGDFNGDGKQDLAVGGDSQGLFPAADDVHVSLGDGLGNFNPPTNLSINSTGGALKIAIGDFNGDSKQDLAVVHSSGNHRVFFGDGLGGFPNDVGLSMGVGNDIGIGDFNSDGKQDFAVTIQNEVRFRFGTSGYNFAVGPTVSVGFSAQDIAIGDFNNDGNQDFATANKTSNSVSIRLGNGTGSFTAMPDVSALDPQNLAIGDFNGDGNQDLAISSDNSVFAYIRYGNGLGNFSGTTSISTGLQQSDIVVGDFNADGKHDLLIPTWANDNIYQLVGGEAEINLRGNATNIPDGDLTPTATDHTDFGLVGALAPLARVFTIQNTGNTTLSISSITSTGANSSEFVVSGVPGSIAAGGSGTFTVTFTPATQGLRTATITVNNNDCTERVYDFAVQGAGLPTPTLGTYANTTLQAGDNATIAPSAAPTNTTKTYAYTHTNFTGVLHVNPTTGVVTVTNAKQAGVYAVTVLATSTTGADTTTFTLTVTDPNCSQGTFAGTTSFATNHTVNAVAIGDFNEDGIQDLAVAKTPNIDIRLGDVLGGFSLLSTISAGTDIKSIAVGDFDGDGNQDLAAVWRSVNNVTIYWGDGLGGFAASTVVGTGAAPETVAIGDFNGDGKQDFAVVIPASNAANIRLGDGARNFTTMPNVATGAIPRFIAVGDFNNDQDQDLAVVNQNSANVSIHWGNGTGNFTAGPIVSVGSAPWAVAIGDFNEDGEQDFVTPNWNVNSVSIRLANGSGGFSIQPDIAAGTQPASVAVGDYNGDGHQDLAVANNTSNDVSILLGNGNGTFAAATTYTTGNGPNMIATGDFNGDGKHDLATANQSSSVSIHLGGEAEINLQGNSVSIADGDLTPTSADHTDFGSVLACSGSLVRNFTVQNNGNLAMTLSGLNITGPHAADFAVPTLAITTLAAGGSTTFQVSFDPSVPGLRTAILSVLSNDCDEGSYDFAIQGMGDADTVDPVITCPASISVGNNVSVCDAVVVFTAPSGTDNCAGASTTQTAGLPSGAAFPVGTTTNTFVATDASGNTATCAFTVTVADTEAPTISCPAAISVGNNVSVCGAAVTYTAPMGSDNCSGASTIQTAGLASGSTFPVGITTNTFEVTAFNGQSANCSFTVTVTDTEAPAISCPANISVGNSVSVCGAVVTYTAPMGADNCAGASTVQTAGLASGSTFPVGITTNTFEVTATNGQTANCSFTVTVTDIEAPTITCPASISVGSSVSMCAAAVTYTAPIGTDNCPGTSTSQIAGLTTGSMFPVGTTTNTFVVTAANGQTATCSFMVNVVDTEAPGITCPAAISVSNNANVCGAIVVFSAPAGSDNCSASSTVQTTGLASGATFPIGVTTNTYVVTDASGQTATCSFTVTVADTEAPTMTCPANITLTIDSVHCEVPVTWTAPTVQDNCGAGTLSSNYSSGDLFSSGTRTVTYTVTDPGGNTATCAFTVTVNQPSFALYVAVYTHAGGANTSCYGVQDGEAGAYPSGGCLPYDYLWSTGQMNQSITGLAPGGYWVTVTDGQGNMAWDTVTIIEALPVATPFITFTQGGPLACQGDTIGLIGPSAAISYNWSNGGNTIGTQVTGSGMISLNIFDQFGCPGVDSVNITIHPAPVPTISQSGNTLSSSPAATYQWYLNGGLLPGATNLTHVATQSGTYTVVVTDANGCEGSSNPLLVTMVGVDAALFDPSLAVFPNPFHSAFTMELDLPEPLEVTATVYALDGAIVWQGRSIGEVQHFGQTIPTHEVAAGVYFLRIQAGEHLIVRKVVKQ